MGVSFIAGVVWANTFKNNRKGSDMMTIIGVSPVFLFAKIFSVLNKKSVCH